jgi:diketogulonate reductase-like aldo/keto reductase
MSLFNNLTLNNNNFIPPFGFGTFKLKNPSESVYNALKLGYRLIDTAKIYNNEEEVGKGINKFLSEQSDTKRSDLFIISKLWQDEQNDPINALKTTLKKLNLNYIDLYLIHWPLPNFENNKFEKKVPLHILWKNLEKCVELNLTKNLGVSNFNSQLLLDLFSYAKIFPVINEIEIHPFFQQKKLINNFKNNIKFISYMSICQGAAIKDHPELQNECDLFNNKFILDLSKKYNQSPQNIILNWHLNREIIPIPRSDNIEHIKDNLKCLEFKMEENEYKKFDELDKNLRINKSEFKVFSKDFDIFA